MHGTAIKQFMKTAMSFTIHFAHGGLLAVGFLVTLLLVTMANSAEGQQRGLLALGDSFIEGHFQKTAAPVFDSGAVFPASGVSATVDYLSRKYRVAATAIEPLVLTAKAVGERTGVDPMLIIAVMAIESGFNPIAESPMGAQGLMQVIPRFHQDKLNAVSGDSLLDPAANIHVGALVLKEYIVRAGSLEAGLKQYAGGISDVEGVYAAKVLAEKQRIESVAKRAVQSNV
ncbi:MAG: lytic transglycosylase domain-containing protein [Zoogloeaceae bacterium]|jgi:soluble lytic murein transglycosylase-like protein|nr:lytic transglycosylase domain-containing protein [Zoogloeaceae bacterium]